MKEIDPVPPELMIGCFFVAGLIVSVAYSINWSQVFQRRSITARLAPASRHQHPD
jgi:hypothetical protein